MTDQKGETYYLNRGNQDPSALINHTKGETNNEHKKIKAIIANLYGVVKQRYATQLQKRFPILPESTYIPIVFSGKTVWRRRIP